MEEENKQELVNIKADNPLSRVIVANKDGSITSAKCHICKSQHRTEIELMYEKGIKIPAIMAFLEQKGEAYARFRLDHHFDSHYKNMAMQAAIIEYRDRLDEMMERRRNMIHDIEFSTSSAWIEFAQATAFPAKNLEEMEQRTRVLAMIQKTIRDNWEFIKSMHDDEAKKRATEERFAKIWLLQLEEAKTDEERKLIIATLQSFKEKLLQTGD